MKPRDETVELFLKLLNSHLHQESSKVREFLVNNQKLIQVMAPYYDLKLLKIGFSGF